MDIVSLKKNIATPKYKQIIASVETAIVNGQLKKGDKLPSLNLIKTKTISNIVIKISNAIAAKLPASIVVKKNTVVVTTKIIF